MTRKHVDLERKGGIALCTISNPPTHTLTATGVGELHAMLDEIEGDSSVRVLVLTGGGEGVFIAHYEVGELAAGAEAQSRGESGGGPRDDPHEPRLHPMHELCLRLERLPAVTIAALNGSAAGGGCELSLACDFRLMADGAFVYGLPETSVGIIPGAGGTQRFARLLGSARALDLILHARLMKPADALELGLVHRLYPADDFTKEVDAFAADLAGRAPVALAAAKQAIHQGLALEIADGLAVEQRCFERTMRSKDAAGAMRAWLKGETWEWTGE
jgi:enoyl-CoA hydratase